MTASARRLLERIILPISLLALFACAQSKHDRAKFILQQPVITITDAKLSDAALAFLSASKTQDITLYEMRRREFEELLSDYLSKHDEQNRVSIQLRRDQMTFVFPLQMVVRESTLGKGWRVLDGTIAWEPVGSRLMGQILDLAVVTQENRMPSLAALFTDSLVTLSLSKAGEFTPSSIRFGGVAGTRRSLFSAGRLRVDAPSSAGRTKLLAEVSTIGTPVAATLAEGRLELLQRNQTSVRAFPDSLSRKKELADLFCCLPDSVTSFRSLHKVPGTDLLVFLDENGYLKLQRSESTEPLWSSSRPWGSRLAVLDSTTVAVFDGRQASFVGFKLEGEAGRLVGQSPRVTGSVSAVTPYHDEKLRGLLVSAMEADVSGTPWSQLYFISYDDFRWRLPVDYAQPAFPQHDAILTLVLERSQWSSDIHDRFGLPATVWVNTVESLVELGVTEPLLRLAQKISPDSTGSVWDIRLRPEVRFADGVPVTAEAVVSGWKSTFRNCHSNDCPSAWQWLRIAGVSEFIAGAEQEIKGLQVVDSLTLRLAFTEPQPDLLERLTQPGFSVIKISSKGELLGTGPFRIQDFDVRQPRSSWICEGSEYYYGDQPALQALRIQGDGANVVDAMAKPGNGLTIARRKKDLKYFRDVGAFAIRPFSVEPIYFLVLNSDNSTLSNVQLRQHLATAVLDRRVISDIVTEAESTPAPTLFSRQTMVVASPEKAQIDYPSRRFRIAYDKQDEVARQIAERLAARLAQLQRFRVSLSSLSRVEFAAQRRQGGYDILVDSFTPTFQTPKHNLAQLLSRGYRVGANMRAELRQFLTHPDAEAAFRLERDLLEQAVLVPLIRIKQFAILPLDLQDAKLVGATGIDLSRAWLAKK